MYVVYYRYEDEDKYPNFLFYTSDKNEAINYVNKFNKILAKWIIYYSRYTVNGIKFQDKYFKYYNRYRCLRNIEGAYYDKINNRTNKG